MGQKGEKTWKIKLKSEPGNLSTVLFVTLSLPFSPSLFSSTSAPILSLFLFWLLLLQLGFLHLIKEHDFWKLQMNDFCQH